jgi:hypothetical protein
MGLISLLALSIAFAVVQVMFQPSLRHHEHKITKWLQGPQSNITRTISLIAQVFSKLQNYPKLFTSTVEPSSADPRTAHIREIAALADQHEVAEALRDLIHKDGAGSWPPNANHTHSSWPTALRPYGEIYLELAALLPQEHPSLDDETNIVRIADFRGRFKSLLAERINLAEVNEVCFHEWIYDLKYSTKYWISYLRLPLLVAGMFSLAKCSTDSTAVSPLADTHIDGPPSLLL